MHVTDVLEPMPPIFNETNQSFLRASSRMPLPLDRRKNILRGSKAVIHHYATRSIDDFQIKINRGTADKKSRTSFRKDTWMNQIIQ